MDRYEQLKVLGRGSYGSAVLVRERTGQRREYVVKEVELSKMGPAAKQEAEKEVQVLHCCEHPNIVRYVEKFIQGASKLCIVMEYADGGDLSASVKAQQNKGSPFPESEVLCTFAQCCRALRHCHGKHILHRDLKCGNIFLTSKGVVKVGDFGISKVLEHTGAVANTMIGTPLYLAPEVCQSMPYGVKADVWSLGVVLHELIALAVPFQAQNMAALVLKIINQPPAPLPHGACSKELRGVVASMLQKPADKRPSVNELLACPVVRGGAASLPPDPDFPEESVAVDATQMPPRSAKQWPSTGEASPAPEFRSRWGDVQQQPEQVAAKPVAGAPRANPPRAPPSAANLAAEEFRRNREMAALAKARAEGDLWDAPAQRAHSRGSEAARAEARADLRSRKAAEEEQHRQALQQAAAQARLDRKQVQQRMAELGRAAPERDIADAAADLPDYEPDPVQRGVIGGLRRGSREEDDHLKALQEAAAEARRDRKRLQQKMKQLEQAEPASDGAAGLCDDAAWNSEGEPTNCEGGPPRGEEARRQAEAQRLQELQDAAAEAFRERQKLQQRRREAEAQEHEEGLDDVLSAMVRQGGALDAPATDVIAENWSRRDSTPQHCGRGSQSNSRPGSRPSSALRFVGDLVAGGAAGSLPAPPSRPLSASKEQPNPSEEAERRRVPQQLEEARLDMSMSGSLGFLRGTQQLQLPPPSPACASKPPRSPAERKPPRSPSDGAAQRADAAVAQFTESGVRPSLGVMRLGAALGKPGFVEDGNTLNSLSYTATASLSRFAQ